MQAAPGESYRDARRRADRQLGQLETIRYFAPGAPGPWSTIRRDVGTRPIVVSFKIPPLQVLSGAADTLLLRWFREAPLHRTTWWSYLPEPEDDIAAHAYTAAQYRSAWRHLSNLAERAHNWRLRSTLVLMCWTLNPLANRRFRDYYAGREVVDVLGWDCYNWGYRNQDYAKPSQIFGKAVRRSRAMGDGFGVAETGSVLTGPDAAVRRAEWLRRVGGYLERQDAAFASYFNVRTGSDYRLLDVPSRHAWRRVVTH